ncbi:unnamed protein product [Amoebophrya sp. A25]|nr:unnamed protein product [Amoebophrya sp. A25]|eukprot:GSA25T00012084001.1
MAASADRGGASTRTPASENTAAARASEDNKNFLVWGAWHDTIIEKPLLTEKVRGAVQKTLIAKTYCVVLRTDGTVVAWGENKQGCLGLGPDTTASSDPKALAFDEAVVDIQMGTKHLLALTAAGRVYAWGSNEYGQLGVGDVSSRFAPAELPLHDSVRQILCVDSCSFAITIKGDVFAWGDVLCGLIPISFDQDSLLLPTPLLALHPYAIRKLELVRGPDGQKTMMAYVDYNEEGQGLDDDEMLLEDETEEAMTEMVQPEKARSEALSKDNFVYQGIHMLRTCLDTTRDWYEQVLALKHGQPYEVDGHNNYLINTNPLANNESEIKQRAANEINSYDLDANASLDLLYDALGLLDRFIKAQEQQQKEFRKIGSKTARFLNALFLEVCQLRREKISRTILTRDMIARKRHIDHLDSFARGSSLDRHHQAVMQLQENARQIRRAASRHDMSLLALQNALVENCELRRHNLELEQKIKQKALPVGELQGLSIDRLRKAWTEMKSFSLFAQLEEIEDQGQLDSVQFQNLVQLTGTKIDAALDNFLPENQLIGHDFLLPEFLYDLLVENGELRKACHAYQLRTLVKERIALKLHDLVANDQTIRDGVPPDGLP